MDMSRENGHKPLLRVVKGTVTVVSRQVLLSRVINKMTICFFLSSIPKIIFRQKEKPPAVGSNNFTRRSRECTKYIIRRGWGGGGGAIQSTARAQILVQ